MARSGRRYPLIMYTRMVDRWWPATFWLGVSMFALAWAIHRVYFLPVDDWRWLTLAGVGGFVLVNTFFMFILRKSAYVQPRADHLRLVTPFLRLNISYKRLRRATSTTMEGLFPPNSVSSWRRDIVEPLARKTAVVVELNNFPIPQWALLLFLSPFFFKDKTPHFVLLVEDWMKFSSELETMRSGGVQEAPKKKPLDKSILSRLPHK